jgi:hypothetical protein
MNLQHVKRSIRSRYVAARDTVSCVLYTSDLHHETDGMLNCSGAMPLVFVGHLLCYMYPCGAQCAAAQCDGHTRLSCSIPVLQYIRHPTCAYTVPKTVGRYQQCCVAMLLGAQGALSPSSVAATRMHFSVQAQRMGSAALSGRRHERGNGHVLNAITSGRTSALQRTCAQAPTRSQGTPCDSAAGRTAARKGFISWVVNSRCLD